MKLAGEWGILFLSRPQGLDIQIFRAGGRARRAAHAAAHGTERKSMCMLDEIRAKRDEIYAIARRHKVERLWVFGLCARREVLA